MNATTKKLASIALTVSTVLWAAGVASLPLANAQSTSSLQAQIAALLSQIQQLQGQLGTTNSSSSTTSSSCYGFTSDLTVGSTGASVSALQQMLIAKGYLTAVSAPTGYFGKLTQVAVGKWQAANGITPAAGYFGAKSRAFYASSCVSTSTTTTTTTTGTLPTGCTSTIGFSPTTGASCSTGVTTVVAPSTGLQVGLASDNPGAGSLISGSAGSGSAARVPVMAVNFTAGNSGAATISDVKFTKTGVLADSSISGAYLVQNGQVVAQYNSLNQGVIDFSGMSLSIPAGQTVELQLAIDVASGLSAGNTTGFALTSASNVTAWSAGSNTAITPTGTFPLNGNTFTVTTVTNPSLATLTITSSSIGTQVTAGTQGNLVGAWVFTGSNSKTWLKNINFHVIGSANMGDIRNVKLMINGTQVGATLATVGQNGLAYFDASANPGVLNTGSNNVQIFADVMGSPNDNFQFEILNSYDVLAVDSQYNIPISVTNTSGTGTQVQIQNGQITVTQDSATPTGQIAAGQSGVTIAKFDIYAAGEAVKVKYLGVKLAFTGATTTAISTMLKNVSLVDDAGNQVGTTINTPPSSNTCDVGPNPGSGLAGYNTAGTSYTDCFGTAASPINYIVPANTTRVLSLKADVQSTAGFSTIVGSLLAETNNLQGMTSSQTASSAGATGSSLSLSATSLTVGKNTSFGDQTITPNSTNSHIGSYAFSASSASGVTINTLSIKAAPTGSGSSDLQNMKVLVNGAQFGTTQGNISDGSTYTFSGTAFQVLAGQTVNIDVYADILSNATTTNLNPASALTGCSGSSVASFSSVSCSGTVNGQKVTVATTGATMTVGLDSSAPAATNLVMGSTGNVLAAFRFAETSNVENVKVTDLTVVQNTTSSARSGYQVNNVSGVALYNGSTLLGISNSAVTSTQGYKYVFHFGSPFIVPESNQLTLSLKGDVANYSSQGSTDNSTSTFSISSGNVTALGASSNIVTTVSGNATSNVMTVLRTTVTPSAAALGATSARTKSSIDNIATVTFTPNTSGAAMLQTLKLTFSGNAIATSTAASTTYNSLSGVGLASNISLLDANNYDVVGSDSATATSTCTAQSNCTVTWTFAANPTSTGAFNLSSPYTFTVRLNDQAGNATAAAANGVTQSLGVTIQGTGDVTYLDATDGTGSTVSMPNALVPLIVTSISFAQGT